MEILGGRPITKRAFPESFKSKDQDTLIVQAHGVAKEMHIKVRGEKVEMSLGGSEFSGHVEGNTYYLKGKLEGSEFRFRLYTIQDKYMFQRETWVDGKIQQIDMAFLQRK